MRTLFDGTAQACFQAFTENNFLFTHDSFAFLSANVYKIIFFAYFCLVKTFNHSIMKALLPVYCRPLGYVVLLVALFIPFILVMQGVVTDTNLLFYKECTKLLMMAGCLLIIFALSKNESRETEQIRNSAVRNAIFLTFLFVFGGMLWRVMQGDVINVDTSSFLTFLVFNVLCLEFGLKKALVDRFFKR